nr:hypothetical protein DM860_014601 [Ipomoea trifida]
MRTALSWKASNNHQWTPNVDGSSKPFSKKVGYSGVLRTTSGDWVVGFTSRLMFGDEYVIETEAIAKGMGWVWKRDIQKLEIQSNASNVIDWICERPALRGPISGFIEDATLLALKHDKQRQTNISAKYPQGNHTLPKVV